MLFSGIKIFLARGFAAIGRRILDGLCETALLCLYIRGQPNPLRTANPEDLTVLDFTEINFYVVQR